jgi:hypothetical protein
MSEKIMLDNAEKNSTVKLPGQKPASSSRPKVKKRHHSVATKKEPSPDVVQEIRPITAEEQAIAARIAADSDREWETIGEDSVIDYSLGRDLFELPPPALKQQIEKHYAFRWIERTQRRIDEIRSKPIPLKWWICNSTNTPFLKGYFDPVLGGVTREDQILVFKPWWMHAKQREIVAEITEGKNQDLTRRNKEKRGAAEFVAGVGDSFGLKGGDKIVYDGDVAEGGGDNADLSDLTAE